MTIIFFLYVVAPFAALFALGYFTVASLGRLLTKRQLVEAGDAWAPFTGMLGTVVGFLFFGLNEYDRFPLAPDHVRLTWQTSGLAYTYEMVQALFSGAVCALILVVIGRFLPRLSQNSRITTPVAALLISFADFSFWPSFRHFYEYSDLFCSNETSLSQRPLFTALFCDALVLACWKGVERKCSPKSRKRNNPHSRLHLQRNRQPQPSLFRFGSW